MDLLGVLEGLLFVVGDEGLTIDDMCEVLNINEADCKELLNKLNQEYQNSNRGIRISYLADTFKLTTKKEHADYYKKLLGEKESTLTQSQLEVLAIIAYNEPITRVEIDNIRGIASQYIVKKLLSKDLIKVCGKSDMPGKPNMYKTTKEFLDYFGLSSISDLPDVSIFNTEEENQELFKK